MSSKNMYVFDDSKTYGESFFESVMSKDEESFLFKEYKITGDSKLLKKIIENNLKLVPYVSRHYSYVSGININELNSYGFEGLIIAAIKYDPSLGYEFSTLAVKYIDMNIKNAILEINGFRLHNKFFGDFIKCKKQVEREFSERFGRDISIWDEPYIVNEIVEMMLDKKFISERQLNSVKNKINIVYHDNYEHHTELFDATDLSDRISSEQMKVLLSELIDSLTKFQSDVIKRRFGFIDGKIWTLQEIADDYGFTKEYIRQIENKAIKRLRNPFTLERLKEVYYK